MTQTLPAIGFLLLATALLMVGGGLFNSFVSLRALSEGFPSLVAGLMMSAFYLGLIAGTLRCGRLIARVGHIRAFGAFCAVSAAAVLLFPFVINPWAWLFLRCLIGFNMAGLFMVLESWLNSQATPQIRSTLMAVYMAISFLAMGSGQLLLGTRSIESPDFFLMAAMFIILAMVPVATTETAHPTAVSEGRMGIRGLIRVSPMAVLGCLSAGLMNGSIYGVGPVFAARLGISVEETGLLMGTLIVSGLILQLPLGRLSDRYDRRSVITGVAIAAAVASFLMLPVTEHYSFVTVGEGWRNETILWDTRPLGLFLVATLYGACTATIYPLSVAWANDHLTPGQMVAASGGMVMLFGVGAIFGPLASGLLMSLVGPVGLFLFTGLVASALAGFSIWRRRAGDTPDPGLQEPFVPMPSPLPATPSDSLDPRTPEAPTANETDAGTPVT